MNMKISALLLGCFSVACFGAEMPTVIHEDKPDFVVDVNELKNGAVQHCIQFGNADAFEHLGGSLQFLQDPSWKIKDTHMFSFSKVAYALPVSARYFIEHRLNQDRDYLLAINPKLIDVLVPNPSKLYVQVHKSKGFSIGGIELGNVAVTNRLELFEAKSLAKKNLSLKLLEQRLGDKNVENHFPLAAVTTSSLQKSEQSVLKHAFVVTKIFDAPFGIVVIRYRLAVVNPNWIMRKALEFGNVTEKLLSTELEDLLGGVVEARKYLSSTASRPLMHS